MKGKLSLKAVLPAIWESNPGLHSHPAFSQYFKHDRAGCVVDPYLTLPPLPFRDKAGEDEEVVNEGSGAICAYQEMLYGLAKNEEDMKEKWKTLLLQYCKLDTAAMVIVWLHWEAAANSLAFLPRVSRKR